MDGFWMIAIETVSVYFALRLWTKAPGTPLRKAVWTPLVLLPVLGPLLYGGLYDAPKPQGEALRADRTKDDDLLGL